MSLHAQTAINTQFASTLGWLLLRAPPSQLAFLWVHSPTALSSLTPRNLYSTL